MVRSITVALLSTEANKQSSLFYLVMSSVVMSGHIGWQDAGCRERVIISLSVIWASTLRLILHIVQHVVGCQFLV